MSASTAKKVWSRPAWYQCSGPVPMHADPAGHRFVGFARERERGVRVGADEDDGGAGGVGLVAGVGEAPAAQERVVGEQLVVVVGGAAGEVELDQQVEGELDRGDAQLERDVGLDLGERVEREVDDRLLVGERDLVEGDRVAVAAGAGLGDGVAAGGVAGGAPVVGRDVRRRGGAARSPRRARAGRGRGAARGPARLAATRAVGRSRAARGSARPPCRAG